MSPPIISGSWGCLALVLMCTHLRHLEAVSFDSVRCDEGVPGMRITVTHPELLSAYTSVFAVSDGSMPVFSDDPQQQQDQVRSMLNVLHMSTGLTVCRGANGRARGGCEDANETAQESLVACGDGVLRMSMLAAIGNFVSPLPAERGEQSGTSTMGGEQVLPRRVVLLL